MSKITEKERVARWNRRTVQSSKDYEDWVNEWSPDLLEQYYYGKQWQGESGEWNKRKYVINLFYPSVNIAKPSFLFRLPKYTVKPRIVRMDDPASDAEARAKLQEATLNTFVQNPNLGYAVETGLAITDAFFRFGVIQVGYTADFIDNPNAGRPMLRDGVDMRDGDGNTVAQPAKTLENERLFLKWIDAKQFRVSENSKNRLPSCDWCGYYEWHYIDDIKANPNYKNTSNLTATGRLKNATDKKDPESSHPGMVKVWFIWDQRERVKRIFADGGEKFFSEKPYGFLPLSTLKLDEILGQWLPLPFTYNWAHPQNELNDTREMQRIHRKRAVRRYLRRNGAIEDNEFDKLCEADDMGSAEVNGDPTTAIAPMQDAPLDAAVMRNVPQSIDDFIRVSGISGESQQIADSDTATQANLIAMAGQVREASRRVVVAQFLSDIGRIMLLTIKENMALPFAIKMHVDPTSPLAGEEAQELAKLWQQIEAEDLGDMDNDIDVELTSMSPVAQEQERTNWLTFLGVVTSPQYAPIFAASPFLLRKTAGLFGIHSERDLAELSRAVEAAAMMVAQAQAAQAGVSLPQNPGPGAVPTNADTQGQLAEQLPVELAQTVQ